MKAVIQITSIFTLFNLMGVGSFQVFSQELESDIRTSDLPISISAPVFLFWNKDSRGPAGFSLGVSASAMLAKEFNVGISARAWLSQSGYRISEDERYLTSETENLSFLAHANWYPSRRHLIFLRGAVGITDVREQNADVSYIRESRYWATTILTGVGWDIQMAHHFYLSPLFEYVRILNNEPALSTTKPWLVNLGLGLTIR